MDSDGEYTGPGTTAGPEAGSDDNAGSEHAEQTKPRARRRYRRSNGVSRQRKFIQSGQTGRVVRGMRKTAMRFAAELIPYLPSTAAAELVSASVLEDLTTLFREHVRAMAAHGDTLLYEDATKRVATIVAALQGGSRGAGGPSAGAVATSEYHDEDDAGAGGDDDGGEAEARVRRRAPRSLSDASISLDALAASYAVQHARGKVRCACHAVKAREARQTVVVPFEPAPAPATAADAGTHSGTSTAEAGVQTDLVPPSYGAELLARSAALARNVRVHGESALAAITESARKSRALRKSNALLRGETTGEAVPHAAEKTGKGKGKGKSKGGRGDKGKGKSTGVHVSTGTGAVSAGLVCCDGSVFTQSELSGPTHTSQTSGSLVMRTEDGVRVLV